MTSSVNEILSILIVLSAFLSVISSCVLYKWLNSKKDRPQKILFGLWIVIGAGGGMLMFQLINTILLTTTSSSHWYDWANLILIGFLTPTSCVGMYLQYTDVVGEYRRKNNLCVTCAYDLRGNLEHSNSCPECATVPTPQTT